MMIYSSSRYKKSTFFVGIFTKNLLMQYILTRVVIKMKNLWRKLDNTAKVFSLGSKDNTNTFRLSVILKEKIDSEILQLAIVEALNTYPSYKVKLKTGFFWNYLEVNPKLPIVEEENQFPCRSINFKKNNDFLFKVTYFNNKINLDMFHALTDGIGATIFFKEILYNYLNLKYKFKMTIQEPLKDISFAKDEYLKNVDKNFVYKEHSKKAFLIQENSNFSNNKTYHYIFDLENFKQICKKHDASITEYLTAIYIYAIYKSVYNESSNKDIIITVPIDLRNHYHVQSFSNFFACMNIEGNIVNHKNISFNEILIQVRKEFKNKLALDNIKKYLARDVKLGTNIIIRMVPLFIKKTFMKYLEKIANQSSTTTLSNIGKIKIEEKYKKYIDNIIVLVNPGRIQKVKCTICSYENNLNVTINSNLINNDLEKEFYELLKKYVGKFKLESNVD